MSHQATRGYGLLENFLAKKRAKLANRLIPRQCRSGRVLDVGCGTTPMFLLATQFKYKFGIDPSVRTHYQNNINLKRFDIERNSELPFKDNFFDVVTMLAVLEHLNPGKLTRILTEIRRILKPEGRLILTTPCPWSDKLLRTMATLRLVSKEEIKEHKKYYNIQSVKMHLTDAGFLKNKIDCGYFEFFLNSWVCVAK